MNVFEISMHRIIEATNYSRYLNGRGSGSYNDACAVVSTQMEWKHKHTWSHSIEVWHTEKVVAGKLISKMSPGVGEAAGLTFDGADRQIISRWRLQYWNKSWNFSNAGGVRKMLLSLGGCFIFTAVCIDSCVSLHCGLMWSISPGSSYFYYLLNFPPLLRVFIFEWNKLSIFVAVGGLPTSHHRWGAKRLWKPSGENVSLNWMC